MKIEIRDLEHTYAGEVHALRGITLDIDTGEQVAIVGQNGAGKTTLVKHLNGLLKPDEGGVVRIGDWDTREHPVAKLASRVGYVFQNPDEQLFCKTVAEEVAFGPGNLEHTRGRVDELVADALAMTDLEQERDTNPYDLSPTWRKMVALASVIAMDTAIVILDEPTTGQDAASVARIGRVIATLRQRGKTVITITHDIDFCAENFERIVVMGLGQVLLDGPAEQVFAEEETLARTYVQPPQLTRLGRRLGLTGTVRDQDGFIEAYRRWIGE